MGVIDHIDDQQFEDELPRPRIARVPISEEDRLVAMWRATLMQGNKEENHVPSGRVSDDFGDTLGHFFGQIGQICVEKYFGVRASRTDLTRYGDGGIDLVINGFSVQAKMCLENYPDMRAYVNKLADFKADTMVWCSRVGPWRFGDIHGFISKKRFKKYCEDWYAKRDEYGQPRWRKAVHARLLTPIDEYMEKTTWLKQQWETKRGKSAQVDQGLSGSHGAGDRADERGEGDGLEIGDAGPRAGDEQCA